MGAGTEEETRGNSLQRIPVMRNCRPLWLCVHERMPTPKQNAFHTHPHETSVLQQKEMTPTSLFAVKKSLLML